MKNAFIAIGILAAIGILYLVIRPSSSPTPLQTDEIVASLPADEQAYYASLTAAIKSGGPPKDGIPAVDKPAYESIAKGDEWLEPNDIVFGATSDNRTFAVPQRILVWHEILNETIDGEPVSITYCPLTGTAIGFRAPDPTANDPSLGVSGKLVNSNLIMYDRASDSYWPQILGQSILGPETGNHLNEFPVIWTTWEKWKAVHPETEVLSRETGFIRNYNAEGDPYGSYLTNEGYYTSNDIIFKPVNTDQRLNPKTVVVGIRDEDRNAVAIVKDTLREDKTITTELGDREITIVYDSALDFYTVTYTDTDEVINAFDAMWFAWYGYYPNTAFIR
jgi:hypothetical protein